MFLHTHHTIVLQGTVSTIRGCHWCNIGYCGREQRRRKMFFDGVTRGSNFFKDTELDFPPLLKTGGGAHPICMPVGNKM